MSTDSGALDNLTASGVAIWLDDLSRDLITSGELAELSRNRNVVGITSNPTIFAKALADGEKYDEQLTALATSGTDVDDAIFTITTDDVRDAADVLRPVFDATDGQDGRVSIEVAPGLAYDVDATVASVKGLRTAVDRPNIFVKIPATREGVEAIKQSIAAGFSINVTLIFSLNRYREVVEAYLSGLEQAAKDGIDLSSIRSVASFFVSRVDVMIDPLLEASDAPGAEDLKSRIAIANARLAYGYHEEVLRSPRWRALADQGATPQRPLWASTGVKDPSLPDTLYVDELVARGTINTMPHDTLEAVADHGRTDSATTDTITPNLDTARAELTKLAAVGIDLDQVTDKLESEGIEKFIDSWNELRGSVAQGLAASTTNNPPGE